MAFYKVIENIEYFADIEIGEGKASSHWLLPDMYESVVRDAGAVTSLSTGPLVLGRTFTLQCVCLRFMLLPLLSPF